MPSFAPDNPSATPGSGPRPDIDSTISAEATSNAVPMPICTCRRLNPETTPAPRNAPTTAAPMMLISVMKSTWMMVMKITAWTTVAIT